MFSVLVCSRALRILEDVPVVRTDDLPDSHAFHMQNIIFDTEPDEPDAGAPRASLKTFSYINLGPASYGVWNAAPIGNGRTT
jgi:hypothetical protein